MPEAKDEAKHEFLVLKKFKGLNTQPSREAIGEDEFAWLENWMPIGNAFMQAVPQVGSSTATLGTSTNIMHFASIGTVNYQICFSTGGGAAAVNLATGGITTIFPGGTFTNPAMDQWKSERTVITDPSGMYSWDGTLSYSPGGLATISVTATGNGYTSTPSVTLTGGTATTTASAVAILAAGGVSAVNLVTTGAGYTAAPAVAFVGGTGGASATATAFIMPTGMGGTAISVYSGRSWVANGRLLSFTAPNTWYDVSTTNAAGSTTITEGSLRQQIYGLEALDNYLYMFGDSSIIIIGDVKVTSNITTFSQTFLSSTTGTTLPATITAMERAIIFVNKYGVFALFGASVQKISKALDGIFPLIDFTQPVSGGLAQIYNILCYVFNFSYRDTNQTRPIQALFFDGKWFLTSQGTINFISPGSINGVLSLWGTGGTDVRQLYQDTTSTIATTLITGLYDLGNPIFDKQVIKSGLEYTAPANSQVTLEIDTELTNVQQVSTSANTLTWFNNSGQQITWVNNGNNVITWVINGFLLDFFPTAVDGKYLGATVRSNSPQVVLNGILMEYVQRAKW